MGETKKKEPLYIVEKWWFWLIVAVGMWIYIAVNIGILYLFFKLIIKA